MKFSCLYLNKKSFVLVAVIFFTLFSLVTSSALAAVPTITSPTVSGVTSWEAVLGANLTSDGGFPIIRRGVCWGSSPAPTTNCGDDGNKTMGIFTKNINFLPPGALTYFRGYASNSAGTGYSSDSSFITIPRILLGSTYGGTITPSAGQVSTGEGYTFPINYGGSQTIYGVPLSGWYIRGLYIDNTNVGALSSYTFNNVLANHTLYFDFAGLTPSGSISTSPTTCTIPLNSNVCTTNVSWSASNVPSGQTSVSQEGTLWANVGLSYSNNPYSWVTYGSSRTFRLYTDWNLAGTLLGSASATGVCTGGTYWNGSICATTDCTGTPWGTMTTGTSNTGYSTASVPYSSSCSSQTRTCTNGTLSGTYGYTSCTVDAPANCTGTPWGTMTNGTSNTAYASAAPAGACSSQTRTCTNGTLSGTYTATSCTAGCTGTPWGSVSSGYSNTAYSTASPSGASCASVSQTRTCTAGTMSGSYTNTSCSSGCSTAWGNLTSGQSITAYSTALPSGVSCASVAQTRTCTNGSFSGSYTNASCSSGCSTTWGNLTSGSSVTAYSTASVPYGSTCTSQSRTCTNGTFSGTYTNASCSVTAPVDCTGTPWGTVAHGSSVTGYSTASPSGVSCASVAQTRTCNNGTLSGSYANTTCSSGCSTTWGNLTSGQSVTAYSTASVPYGNTCTSQTRTCTNGTFSGTYTNASCTVDPPTDCLGTPWGTVLNGNSVTGYQTSSVVSPSSCASQTRTCSGGTLTGTYSNTSCTVMSGTLTSSSPTCTIASGASSCNVNLTWSTTNPVGTSAITRNNPSGTVFNGNSGTAQTTAVSGGYANVSFYLYNNGSLLSTVTVTPSCTAGTDWDGSKCAARCNIPWGGTMISGSSIIAYQSSTIPSPGTCPSIAQTRTCSSGTLSGTYTNQTCTVTFVSGTLAIPANCTIASGASTCTTVASWSTTNALTPALVDENIPTTLSTLPSSLGLTVWVSHPSTIFNLKDNGSTVLDTMTVSSTCAAGSTWDGSICSANCTSPWSTTVNGGTSVTAYQVANVQSPATCVPQAQSRTCNNGILSGGFTNQTCSVTSGTLTSSSPTCTIASGASSCNVNLTWSTTNPVGTSAITRNNPSGTVFNGNSGTAQSVTVSGSYTNVTYYLFNNAWQLATVTITPSCVSGTSWVGGKCAPPPSATLTVPNCSIAIDASSCSSTVSWVSSDLLVALSVQQNGTQFSAVATSAGVSRTLQYGSGATNVFTITHSGTTLDTKTGIATCVAGTTWDGSKCVLPSAVLTVPDCTIPAGASTCTTSVSWTSAYLLAPLSVQQNGTQFAVTASSLGIVRTLQQGLVAANDFKIISNSITLDAKTGKGICISGTTWNGLICALPGGNVTSSSPTCTIASGASSCNVTLTWTTTDPFGVSEITRNNPGGTVFTANNGNLQSTAVSGAYPSVTYYLYNNAIELASTTVVATCITGTVFIGTPGKCEDNATASLSVGTSSASYGYPADLTWTSTHATLCTAGGDPWSNINPPTGTSLNGSSSTPALTTSQLYTFQCTGNGAPSPTATATVTVCGAGFPLWDGATCQPSPYVTGFTVDYPSYPAYAPANLNVLCSNATSFDVTLGGTTTNYPLSQGPISVSTSGTYSVLCKKTSADGHIFPTPNTPPASTPQVISYSSATPTPIVSLRETPASISRDSAVTIYWTIKDPVPECRLTAAVICPNGVCSADQLVASSSINLILSSGSTDVNDSGNASADLAGLRPITDSLTTIVPESISHQKDWKAFGKRTFYLKYSTEFFLNCGSLPNESQKVRVLVTGRNEG